MRATDLLGMDVLDGAGTVLGQVLDAYFTEDGFALTALIVGSGRTARLAASAGTAQGRLAGPAVLRRWMERAAIERIAVERVISWGPAEIRITGPGSRG